MLPQPRLYIIAGCNGAGKTTASYTLLPRVLQVREFVNADEIARGLSPFNPENMAILAGKLMLRRIEELLAHGESFAIETTLATRSYVHLVRNARQKGYVVSLLFFYLNDVELARQRVAERVAHGGHNIPDEVIVRRYWAGINNLFHIYMKEVDDWVIYDNSQRGYPRIAYGGKGKQARIIDPVIYQNIKAYE